MTIESGTEFGAYTIEGPIAGGGMGQVYAARHNVYGSVVALKVLHKQLHADAEWRLRFNLESVIGQQLKHPHVVAARELIEHEDHVGIVLDLVSGGLTLHRCISREYSGGLPLDQALRVFLAIVQGVEYAHFKMVTHGDIKPENVLIEGAYRDPTTWVAKVTDFGTVGIMAHPVMIDGRAAVVVSPRYAAPEHLLGIDRLEPRSDIYCLGLLLHYLLTGKHASTARTVEEAAYNTSMPMSMLALVDQPEPLRAIIQKACATDIDERYNNCGELAVAVRSAMDALGVLFEVEDVAADLATEMMPERDAMRRSEPADGLTLDPGEPLSTSSSQDGIETEELGPDDIDPAVRAAAMFASEGLEAEEAAGGELAESGAASAESPEDGHAAEPAAPESNEEPEAPTAEEELVRQADGAEQEEPKKGAENAADEAAAADDADAAAADDAAAAYDAAAADESAADKAADSDAAADEAAADKAADDAAADASAADDAAAADHDASDAAAAADEAAADNDSSDDAAAAADEAAADKAADDAAAADESAADKAADSDAAADEAAADNDASDDAAAADDDAAADASAADDADKAADDAAAADESAADKAADNDADEDDIDPRLDPALAHVDPNTTFGGEFFTAENPALSLTDDDAPEASFEAEQPAATNTSTGLVLAAVALVVVVLGVAFVLLSS